VPGLVDDRGHDARQRQRAGAGDQIDRIDKVESATKAIANAV
jgi:hypothetical protein